MGLTAILVGELRQENASLRAENAALKARIEPLRNFFEAQKILDAAERAEVPQ